MALVLQARLGARIECGQWGAYARRLHPQTPFVSFHRLPAGLHVELVLKDGPALLVGARDPRAVAAQGVQPHDLAVEVLAQGIAAHEVLGKGDGVPIGSLLLQSIDEPLQDVRHLLLQPFALRHDPVVVAQRQERPPVEVERLLQILRGLRLVERCEQGVHVEGVRRARQPLHRLAIGLDEMLTVHRQGLAQCMEQVAQIRARLRLGGIGPEEKGEALPCDGRVTVQQ